MIVSGGEGSSVVEVTPPTVAAKPPTFASKHPLFSHPKKYYDKTNGNKLAKTASATFIGVPSGVAGEIRQAFTGGPPASTSVTPSYK